MRASIKKSQSKKHQFYHIHNGFNDSKRYEKVLDYVEEHGSCEYGSIEYARLLRLQGRNEEALEALSSSINTKNHLFALSELSIIEFSLGKYFECLNHILELKRYNEKQSEELLSRELYCYFKLNMPCPYNYDELRYSYHQIINYNEEMSLRHIYMHELEAFKKVNKVDKVDLVKCEDTFFNSFIDIDELFSNIRNILKNIKRDCERTPISEHIFYYPGIGNNARGKSDYLKVISVLGTNNIVTMFPEIGIDKMYLKEGHQVYDYEIELEKLNGKAL